jgi:hypothetical protein
MGVVVDVSKSLPDISITIQAAERAGIVHADVAAGEAAALGAGGVRGAGQWPVGE